MTIAELERAIRYIFNKSECTTVDVELGNYYIKEWKRLTGWKEDTRPVFTFTVK